MFIAVFSVGYVLAFVQDENNAKGYYGNYLRDAEGFKIQIESIVKKGTEYYTVKGEVDNVKLGDDWVETKGTILCYIVKDSSLKSGDILVTNSAPDTFDAPKNPGNFNLKSYYSNIGIYYYVFLGEESFVKDEADHIDIEHHIDRLRWDIRDQLVQSLEEREAGVSIAMLLGMKHDLSDDLKYAYANIGVMHILAVSGLHVGILFMVIRYLFGGFRYHVVGRWVFLILASGLIWNYALLAGLSSSVFRAAIMFSVFLVGEVLNRKNYILNSLAFAAFIILVIEPNALFDVGFQLSFTAVTAIVLLYPPLERIFTSNNLLMRSTWQLICVSVAAQIGTLPLSLFYFHQFPPGFIVANLFAIPLAFVMLSAGFAYVSAMFIGISDLMTGVLQQVIYMANEIFLILENLFPVMDGVYLNSWQVILIYLLIISTYAYFAKAQVQRFAFIAISFTGLIIISTVQLYNTLDQDKIIFYSTSDGIVVDGITGRHYAEIVLDDINEDDYQYQVASSRAAFGASISLKDQSKIVKTGDQFDLAVIIGKSVLSVKNQNIRLPENLKVDFLVLTNGKLNDYWYEYYSLSSEKIIAGPDAEVEDGVSDNDDVHILQDKYLEISVL